MLYPMMPTPFENIQETKNVAVDIGMWIDKGVTHACLGRKIDYPFKTRCAKKHFNSFAIGNIGFYKVEPLVR